MVYSEGDTLVHKPHVKYALITQCFKHKNTSTLKIYEFKNGSRDR